MLKIENLSVAYGAIEALHNISLTIGDSEIVAIIGANGAGKSTLLKTISGLLRPKNGEIIYFEKQINNIKPNVIVGMGICHVPEGRRIFANMTVIENLQMGAHLIIEDKNTYKKTLDRVFDFFPRLYERQDQKGGTLSGGEQQMLAIGRALMGNPKLLLLDEPSLGLAPVIIEVVYEIIAEIRNEGIPILLVEQNAFQALNVADRGYVIETGNIVLEDYCTNLLKNSDIRKAYLGSK